MDSDWHSSIRSEKKSMNLSRSPSSNNMSKRSGSFNPARERSFVKKMDLLIRNKLRGKPKEEEIQDEIRVAPQMEEKPIHPPVEKIRLVKPITYSKTRQLITQRHSK